MTDAGTCVTDEITDAGFSIDDVLIALETVARMRDGHASGGISARDALREADRLRFAHRRLLEQQARAASGGPAEEARLDLVAAIFDGSAQRAVRLLRRSAKSSRDDLAA
jgi:hypothetical protein